MPSPPHGSSGDMTTRETVMNLMAECMEDARAVARREASFLSPESAVLAAATLAAAMFEARWTAGAVKLLEEVKRQ